MGTPLMALGLSLIVLASPVPGPAGVFLAVGGLGLLWVGYFRFKDGR